MGGQRSSELHPTVPEGPCGAGSDLGSVTGDPSAISPALVMYFNLIYLREKFGITTYWCSRPIPGLVLRSDI